MATVNEHTGDALRTKGSTEAYRNNYDAIFGKKKTKEVAEEKKVEDNSTGETLVAQ